MHASRDGHSNFKRPQIMEIARGQRPQDFCQVQMTVPVAQRPQHPLATTTSSFSTTTLLLDGCKMILPVVTQASQPTDDEEDQCHAAIL